MKKLFIDCDVILDMLLRRLEFFSNAQILFTQIEKGKVKGLTSGLSLSNIFYILQKLTSKREAFNNVRKLSLLLSISPINQNVINNALNSSFSDFEDSVQNYSAIEAKANYLITRNVKHYKESTLLVLTPAQINSIITS